MSRFALSFTSLRNGVREDSEVGGESFWVGFLGHWKAESVEVFGLIGAGLKSTLGFLWVAFWDGIWGGEVDEADEVADEDCEDKNLEKTGEAGRIGRSAIDLEYRKSKYNTKW